MIIVLFGQPHSGKTTLAEILYKEIDERSTVHHIDGDRLRDLFSNKDYSREGRIKNLNRASDIATYLNSFGNTVIISMVYPYKEAREYLNSLVEDVKWIHLSYDEIRGRENFHVADFDSPIGEACLQLNTSIPVEGCIKLIKTYINEYTSRG